MSVKTLVSSSQLELLQELFSVYWIESGMSTEADADYEYAENAYIDRQIGTSDWMLVD